MDVFYEPDSAAGEPEDIGIAWQAENDKCVGPDGVLSTQDRRLMWASWGDHNMGNVWQTYHDSAEKYTRLCDIKKKVDPKGVFTPNLFCVGVAAAPPEGAAQKPRARGLDAQKAGDLLTAHVEKFLADNPDVEPGSRVGARLPAKA
jgi:hypothetical protein